MQFQDHAAFYGIRVPESSRTEESIKFHGKQRKFWWKIC